MDGFEKFLFDLCIIEEAPSGARIADTNSFADNTKTPTRGILITTDNYNCARAHVLFFAHHARNSLSAVVAEGFCGIFQESWLSGRLGGRHGWRQIDQPFRIRRKTTHDFQSGKRVFFTNCYIVMKPCRDDSLSNHIIDIEQVVMNLLRSEQRNGFYCRGKQWLDGLGICLTGRNRKQFSFRIPKRCQIPAKDTAGIDVDGSIQPIRLRDGGMAVDDHSPATVLGGPVVANRQPKLVRLTRRFAIQRKVADFSRASTLHFLFHPCVSNNKLSIVQDVVTDELIDELQYCGAKRWSLRVELFERLRKPMGDLHILPAEFTHQLDIVITGNAQSRSRLDHTHH